MYKFEDSCYDASQAHRDALVWGRASNGRFTTKSAYELLEEGNWSTPNNKWKLIWSWRGPQIIRSFMWLAVHNRLMTNENRYKRHIASSPDCVHCQNVATSLVKEEAASRMGFVQIGAAGHQGIEEAVGITGVGGITVATALVRVGAVNLSTQPVISNKSFLFILLGVRNI